MINNETLKALRGEINAALESVGKKYNVQLVADSCKYNSHFATFKLNVSNLSEDGQVVDEHMSYLRTMRKVFGLTEEHLNQTFKIGSEDYVLSGYNPRARTRDAIITKLSDGKKYMASMQTVTDILLRAK